MALFKNMAITYKGMVLYAKAQAGQEIHFTKMQVGSGKIGTQNPATLNTLVDFKLDVPITSITPFPELKSACIVGNITNKNIKEAIYVCEIGLFANDPDEGEILYGYASCGEFGDYYSPESQGPFSWQYEINVAVGNTANITAELSLSNWDYDIKNSNLSLVKISGGNQKEINKSIDNYLNEHDLNFKKIDNVIKEVKSSLEDTTKFEATKGQANGLASLGEDGKLLSSQMRTNTIIFSIPGTYQWKVPEGIKEISISGTAGGGGGSAGTGTSSGTGQSGGAGGVTSFGTLLSLVGGSGGGTTGAPGGKSDFGEAGSSGNDCENYYGGNGGKGYSGNGGTTIRGTSYPGGNGKIGTGGAGGGGTVSRYGGSGGGGANYIHNYVIPVTPNNTYIITIGAGGKGGIGINGGGNGGDGGNGVLIITF